MLGQQDTFQLQKSGLDLYPGAVADEFVSGSDHAMARDQDGQQVGA
jgi:hypothetical protein